MAKSKSSYFLYGMILLSLALGIFVSYLLLFANALFISEIGTSKLPMAYLISGIGGLFITYLFNYSEKKWGFAKASTFFSLFLALVIFLIWYAYVQNFYSYYVVFFAYAMYWISVNFTALVFWKIPSNIFNLEENKKYSGTITSGEVISAIISYLSVPILLSLDFFTRDKFLLISFFGILSFSGITFLLSKGIKTKAPDVKISDTKESGLSDQKQLIKEPYFKLIFLSVLLAVVIQLVIDFCLMEVSANQMSDPLELAKYFSFIFGGMRVLELVLKSFVSKFLIKEYGVFISLSTLIFALVFTTIIGISTYFTGYLGLILIVASLGKVFERSLYRSLYAPTINLLYQAYPMAKRSLTQNYADGFGKTIGQLVAAVFILCISFIEDFEIKVFALLLLVLVVLIFWLFISKKLIFYYRAELFNIIKGLTVTKEVQETTGNEKSESSQQVFGLESDPVKHLIQLTKQLLTHEDPKVSSIMNLSSSLSSDSQTDQAVSITEEVIATAMSCNAAQLLKTIDQLAEINKTLPSHSRLIELIELFLQATLIQKSPQFNFYNSQRKLKAVDFLNTTVIQHLVKKQVQDLDNQDYYFLLEERIQKYTYLLICYKDLGKSYPIMDKLLLSETKAAKNDILFCLSFKHDPVTLNQIVTMINQGGDKSQELISLELLELILEEQEKKWVLPIFKETTPEKILLKLASDFPQVLLGQEKRLISLVTSYNLDIPDLIKSQAFLALQRDFPSPANQGILNSLKKNNVRMARLVTVTSKVDTEVEESDSRLLDTTPFGVQIKKEMLRYHASEELTSLHHFYWMSDTNEIEGDNEVNTSLESVYKTLFPTVFPMEKLN